MPGHLQCGKEESDAFLPHEESSFLPLNIGSMYHLKEEFKEEKK